MFENLVKFLKAPTAPKEHLNLYAVAIRYTVDEEPKLSTIVFLATTERCAIERLCMMVKSNNFGKKVVVYTTIANKVNKNTIDRIKKEC